MTHTKSNIVQYNEYYPFGLQTANSWTRENATGNNFLANGGTEFNATSNLYDLDYRNYDPVLGRMKGVDPMATKYASLTPYNYSFNDPVSFTDPSGADPAADGYSPIYEQYTSWMYSPTYGRLQDDVIYGRLIGWKDMRPGFLVGQDWMFRGAGQGITGSGSWQASTFAGIAVPRGGRGMNITIDLNALPDGAHFFSFSNGNLTNYNFLSESTVLGLGSAYNLAFVGGTTRPIISDYTGGPRLWGNAEGTVFSQTQGWSPLYKSDLEAYAKSIGYCTSCTSNQLGTLFESIFQQFASTEPSLVAGGFRRNMTKFTLADRRTVPDFIADALPTQKGKVIARIPGSVWFEAKAWSGGLYESSSTYQIGGHIDNLYRSTMHFREFPNFSPALYIVTTADVTISPGIYGRAAGRVDVYQVVGQYQIVGGNYIFNFVR